MYKAELRMKCLPERPALNPQPPVPCGTERITGFKEKEERDNEH